MNQLEQERPLEEQTEERGGWKPDSAQPSGPQNSKERLYDRMPVTYRQVDIFLKIMMVVLAVVLAVGILGAVR